MIKHNGKRYFGNNSLQFQRDESNPYWELFIFVTQASFEGLFAPYFCQVMVDLALLLLDLLLFHISYVASWLIRTAMAASGSLGKESKKLRDKFLTSSKKRRE